MKVYSAILVISLFFNCCQFADNKERSNIKTFDLKGRPLIANLALSNLGIVDISYIPLESNEECLIDQIGRIKINGNLILIHCFKAVLLFRDNGSFVTNIGTFGNGPNEYQMPQDMGFDNINQNIYIVSGWQKKFNVYSNSGEFKRTFKIPIYSVVHFRFTEEDEILCYSDNLTGSIENSYVLMDTMGAIIRNFPNRYPFNRNPKHPTPYENENLFYQYDNRLYKKEVYSDTIFVYENKGFIPHLVLGVGDRLVTPKAREENDFILLGKNYITPLNLFEFGNYIYYEFDYERVLGNKRIICGFIGSKDGDFQAIIDSRKGLINDLDGGPNIWPKGIKDDNTIISWINASELKEYINSNVYKNSTPKYPEKKKELEKLAASLKETDNPVLVLLRLKNRTIENR